MTKYVFDISPCGAQLELDKTLILPASWQDLAASDKLIVGSGLVDDSQAGKLICHSGPPEKTPVVTLVGASWDSKPGDSSDDGAHCDLCQNTPTSQSWRLIKVY